MADSSPRITNIRHNWGRTRAGIQEIIDAAPHAYTPEHVYAECIYGGALFVESSDGFVVVQPITNAYNGDRVLYVWVAYAHNKGKNLVTEHDLYFIALAKQLDCAYIELDTAIPGVYNYLSGLGWQLMTYNMRKDVNGQRTEKVGL